MLLEGGDTECASTVANETNTLMTDAITMRKIKNDAFAKALEGGGGKEGWK